MPDKNTAGSPVEQDISQLGKGAVKQPEDPRDYDFGPIAAAAEPIDWDKEFRLPEPPNENQNGSSSCTSQAVSYYHWQLRKRDYSRRDIYSQIYLPQGGAYGRDAVKFLVNKGQATRDETPDPNPQTELAMRNKAGVSAIAEASDIEANYFLMATGGIEGIAIGVRDHKGCVFGVYGNNVGWQNKDNPTPPTGATIEWAHYLYAFGYHTHAGEKCIIAKSSWCTVLHHEHHIKEKYFTNNMTFDRWVIVAKDNAMLVKKTLNNKGAVGVEVLSDGVNVEADFAALNAIFGTSLEVKPDGTIPTEDQV